MAAKIKDGLFIGDAETSQSEVFINDNKISNLINVAGRDVPNVWASHGLVYLTYNWEDRPDYRLLTGHEDSILTDIVEFIDVSISHGISVLIFSKRGTGRCIIAACLYLMMKYRWGFEKSYDYVFSKKPDVDLNKGFIQQMFALDMKLLASRQKAYALKHGIDNGFRIEPNMTINDIAAMLPVNEAKRWNSWDPSYILNPNASSTSSTTSPNSRSDVADPVGMNKLIESEENVHWFKYGDSVIQTVKKKDYNIMKSIFLKQKINTRALDDMEEELVLIFSFINSKNTITSLPGPYHNAIDIPKNFKLKFDQVVFEEDINWFPPAANMKFVPKGILKGGKLQYITPSTSAANQERSQKIRDEKESSMSSSSAGVRSSMERPSSASRNDPMRSSIGSNSGSAGVGTSSGSAVGFKDGNTDDLYKFVGMSAQPKDAMGGMPTSSSSSAPRSREDKKADTNMRSSYDPESKSSLSSSQGQSGQQANTALSAEERLRKLMADMQKQSYFPEHLKPPSQSQPQQSFSSSTSQASKTTTVDPYYSTNATSTSSTAAPSLYDLANMHVAPASAGDAKEVAFIEEALSKDYATSIDLDDNLAYSTNMSGAPAGDPLAAFEINRLSGKNLSSSSSGGAGSGAMRARHDILNSTTTPSSRAGPPPVVGRTATSRQAWTSSSAQPSASTSTPTRGSSAGNPRYASPNVRSSQNNATSNVSSNYSVTSVGSNTSNNSSLPNSFVGAGSTSSAKVYRHGSPAPNTRPTNSSSRSPAVGTRASASAGNSNMSVVSASMSSLGSLGSAAPPTTNRYSSPQVNRTAGTTTTSRYASPTPSSVAAAQNAATAARRTSLSSQNSVGSTGSNQPPSPVVDRRKAYGTSPMRSSYNPPSSGYGSRPASPAPDPYGSSSATTSKRFSTTTPQSAQHHDYDSSQRRPSTPTRGWKF